MNAALPLLFILVLTSFKAAAILDTQIRIRLDAPLSSGDVSLPLDQMAERLGQIDHGSSPLPPTDQQILLETALRSLARPGQPHDWANRYPEYINAARTELSDDDWHRSGAIETAYYNRLDTGGARSPRDLLLTTASVHSFVPTYVGFKLAKLHDRLNLGWRDIAASRALPEILVHGAEQNVVWALKIGSDSFIKNYVRMLGAFRQTPELAGGPEMDSAFAEFTSVMESNLSIRLASVIRSDSWRFVDALSVGVSSAILVGLAVVVPVWAYQAYLHGVPNVVAANPAAYVSNAALLTVPSVLLNIVARGRVRERAAATKGKLDRFVAECESALNPVAFDE